MKPVLLLSLLIFLPWESTLAGKTICYKVHEKTKTHERCIIKGRIVDGKTVDHDQRLAKREDVKMNSIGTASEKRKPASEDKNKGKEEKEKKPQAKAPEYDPLK